MNRPLNNHWRLNFWGGNALLMAIYFFAGKLALMAPFADSNVTLIWPPTGIAAAAIFLFGYRVWPGIAMGAFLVNVVGDGPLGFAVATAIGNPLPAVLAFYFLQRFTAFDAAMERIHDVFWFVVAAVVICTVASATIGVIGLSLTGVIPWTEFSSVWFVWWAGDSMGVLLVAPVLLTCRQWRQDRWPLPRAVEGAALLTMGLIGGAAVYLSLLDREYMDPLAYIAFPFVIWAAVRFEQRGAVLVVFMLSALAIWGATNGVGPFFRADVNTSLIYLHGFLSILAITGLLVAATTEMRRREVELTHYRNNLNDLVNERTVELQREIEERKNMEEVLKDSKEHFRSVIDNSPSFITLKDVEGRFQLVNRTYLDMTGHEFQDILGKRTLDLLPETTAFEVLAQDRKVMENKSSVTEEREHLTTQGIRDFIVTKFPVLDETGAIKGIGTIGTDVTEVNRAESLLTAAIEGMPEGFAYYDADDRLAVFNQKMLETYPLIADIFQPGTRFEEVLRAGVARGQYKVEEGREEEFIKNRLASHRNPKGAVEYVLPDGRCIRVNEQRTPDGGIVGVRTDITELKRVEEALRESEAILSAVVNHSPTKINVKDLEGRYKLINKEAQKLIGATDKEWFGKTTYDMFQKEMADSFRTHDHEVIKSGEASEVEEEFSRDDGVHTYLTTKFPIFEKGEITGLGSIGIDITERKKAEIAKQEMENRLQVVIDSSPAAITLKNSSGVFLLVNRTFGKWMSVNPSDLIGKTAHDIYLQHEAYDIETNDQIVFETGEEIIREVVRTYKDGQTRNVLVNKCPIYSFDGEIIAISTITLDISERKQAEEARQAALVEAEQANRAKSKFLATMSHDLRTPLNAIIGFADILKGQYFGPITEKYMEYADDIQSSGQHLLSLVNDILDLSTIEAGRQSLVKEKLSTMEVVRECEKIVEEKAHSNGIDLVIEVPDNLPPLYADRRASKQILINLLSNAVKFTPQGGKITVSVKASKKNTKIKVADTGKGIPAEKLPKLTDPFTRVGSDPYLSDKGWGLGLAITQSLIDLHDGTLEIKSKVGKGTTVTVMLPNAAA